MFHVHTRGSLLGTRVLQLRDQCNHNHRTFPSSLSAFFVSTIDTHFKKTRLIYRWDTSLQAVIYLRRPSWWTFMSSVGKYWAKRLEFFFAHCLKITQNVAYEFLILAFFTSFCPIKTGISGNTVWPQASGFQKLAKMDHFRHF